jgi:hypothetical protein
VLDFKCRLLFSLIAAKIVSEIELFLSFRVEHIVISRESSTLLGKMLFPERKKNKMLEGTEGKDRKRNGRK